MLVLMRRKGEKIVINDNIVIKVDSLTRKQVHLAIEAPKDVSVFREELLDDLVGERQETVRP